MQSSGLTSMPQRGSLGTRWYLSGRMDALATKEAVAPRGSRPEEK